MVEQLNSMGIDTDTLKTRSFTFPQYSPPPPPPQTILTILTILSFLTILPILAVDFQLDYSKSLSSIPTSPNPASLRTVQVNKLTRSTAQENKEEKTIMRMRRLTMILIQ